MKFYLIRHGETDWNMLGRLQGHSDIALNERGISQARASVSTFAQLGVQRVFSSDLQRAHSTAKILAPHLTATTHVELREIHLGKAEGIQREQISRIYGPDFLVQWASPAIEHLDLHFPEGESKNASIQRFSAFLNTTIKDTKGRFAIVSHGLILKTWLCSLYPELGKTLSIPNLCILAFDLRNDIPVFLGPIKLLDPEA